MTLLANNAIMEIIDNKAGGAVTAVCPSIRFNKAIPFYMVLSGTRFIPAYRREMFLRC